MRNSAGETASDGDCGRLGCAGFDYKDGEPEHIATTGRLFRRTCVDFRDAL